MATKKELFCYGDPSENLVARKNIASARPGLAFFPDGKRFMLGSALFDVETKKKLRVFEGPPKGEGARSVAISSNGKRVLAGCADGMLRLWDVETEKQLWQARAFLNSSPKVYAVAISPDGKYALSGGDGWLGWGAPHGPPEDNAVRLWRLPD